MATKLLIAGLPNSGKTSLIKDLPNSFVVNRDGKKFPFNQPHFNADSFEYITDLRNEVEDSISIYEEKIGSLPETIVFDSVSRIFAEIVVNCDRKYTGYTVWKEVNSEITLFTDFINDLVDEGINVILISHAVYDENSKNYVETSQGNFGKTGGFLSTVDYSIYIELKGNKRIVNHKNKQLARTLDSEIPESQEVKDFNLYEYLTKIAGNSNSVSEWEMIK